MTDARKKYEGVAGRLSMEPTPDDLAAGVDAIFDLLRLLEQRTQERDEALALKQRYRDLWYRDEKRVRELEAALAQYADARNWGISRDDLNYRVVAWIGPGADQTVPNPTKIAAEALLVKDAALADCNRRKTPEDAA